MKCNRSILGARAVTTLAAGTLMVGAAVFTGGVGTTLEVASTIPGTAAAPGSALLFGVQRADAAAPATRQDVTVRANTIPNTQWHDAIFVSLNSDVAARASHDFALAL